MTESKEIRTENSTNKSWDETGAVGKRKCLTREGRERFCRSTVDRRQTVGGWRNSRTRASANFLLTGSKPKKYRFRTKGREIG